MSFILDKTITILEDPKKSFALLRIVDSYPCALKFEYVARCKNGKVGNIKVTNLRSGNQMNIKPHQCSCLDSIKYEVV